MLRTRERRPEVPLVTWERQRQVATVLKELRPRDRELLAKSFWKKRIRIWSAASWSGSRVFARAPAPCAKPLPHAARTGQEALRWSGVKRFSLSNH